MKKDISELTERDYKIFDKWDNNYHAGKEVLYEFKPLNCMMDWHRSGWKVEASKDEYGNIELKITKKKIVRRK